jgi:hypothetical protein
VANEFTVGHQCEREIEREVMLSLSHLSCAHSLFIFLHHRLWNKKERDVSYVSFRLFHRHKAEASRPGTVDEKEMAAGSRH